MSKSTKFVLALVFGIVAGWYAIVGFCNIPSLKFSIACGHNAPYWLLVFVPLCVWFSWHLIGRLVLGASTTVHDNGSPKQMRKPRSNNLALKTQSISNFIVGVKK